MAQITAALVKELREKTGAGMMDCKKALAETSSDLEAAVDWLRTKGLAAAAKKAGRIASEGLIGLATTHNKGALVEINAETDFVARNETFQNFVSKVAQVALTEGNQINNISNAKIPDGEHSVEEELTHLIATIGENMTIRRAAVVSVSKGVLASYIHNAMIPGMGKIGVLVGINGNNPEFGKQIAMHIAAANPTALNEDSLNSSDIEKEKQIQLEIARESGKPEAVIEKMIVGRMKKFVSESTLMGQSFVINPDLTVEAAAKDAGVEITDYIRLEVGEGIEKKTEDFAAEVAKTMNS